MERGDWRLAELFLKRQEGRAVAAKITYLGQTALHVAVWAGHEEIVEKLVNLMLEEDLEILNKMGNTALANSINAGNLRMAACMLRKNKKLVCIENDYQQIPVIQALGYGHIQLARYLYTLTPLGDLTRKKPANGAAVCIQAIYNRCFGKNSSFNNLLPCFLTPSSPLIAIHFIFS